MEAEAENLTFTRSVPPRFYADTPLAIIEDPAVALGRDIHWEDLVKGTIISWKDGTEEEIISVTPEEQRRGSYFVSSIIRVNDAEFTLSERITYDHLLTGRVSKLRVPKTQLDTIRGGRALQPDEVSIRDDSLTQLSQLALQTPRPATIRLTGSSAGWLNPEHSSVAADVAQALQTFDGVLLYGDTAIFDRQTGTWQFTAQDIPGLLKDSPATVIGIRIAGDWIPEQTLLIREDGQRREAEIISGCEDGELSNQVTVYGNHTKTFITADLAPTNPKLYAHNWKWRGEVDAAVQAVGHLSESHLFQKPILLAIDGGATVREEIEVYRERGWPIILYSPPSFRSDFTAVGKLVSDIQAGALTIGENEIIKIAENGQELVLALKELGALGDCPWEQQIVEVNGKDFEERRDAEVHCSTLSKGRPLVEDVTNYVDGAIRDSVSTLSRSLVEGSLKERDRFIGIVRSVKDAGNSLLSAIVRSEMYLPREGGFRPPWMESSLSDIPGGGPAGQDKSANAPHFFAEYRRRLQEVLVGGSALSNQEQSGGLVRGQKESGVDLSAFFDQFDDALRDVSRHQSSSLAPVYPMRKTVQNCRMIARMMSDHLLEPSNPHVPDSGLVASFKSPAYLAQNSQIYGYENADGSYAGFSIYLDPEDASHLVPELDAVPPQFGRVAFIRDLFIDPNCDQSGRVYSFLANACDLRAIASGADSVAWYVSADNRRGFLAHSLQNGGDVLYDGNRSQLSPSGEDGLFFLMIKSLRAEESLVVPRRDVIELGQRLYERTHPAAIPSDTNAWKTLYQKLQNRVEFCQRVLSALDRLEAANAGFEQEAAAGSVAELLIDQERRPFESMLSEWREGRSSWREVVAYANKRLDRKSKERDITRRSDYFVEPMRTD